MARRLGKSRTSITESLALNRIPEEVKNLCRLADIHSKSLFLQIVRQGDPQKMVALVERSPETAARPAKPSAGKPPNPKPAARRRTPSAKAPPKPSNCSSGSRSPESVATKSSKHSKESSKSSAPRNQKPCELTVPSPRRSRLPGSRVRPATVEDGLKAHGRRRKRKAANEINRTTRFSNPQDELVERALSQAPNRQRVRTQSLDANLRSRKTG